MTEQPLPRPLLLTAAELRAWLKVSTQWVKDRLDDPKFVDRCVINLAPEDSPRRTLRFNADALAEWLSIPAPSTGTPTAVDTQAAA